MARKRAPARAEGGPSLADSDDPEVRQYARYVDVSQRIQARDSSGTTAPAPPVASLHIREPAPGLTRGSNARRRSSGTSARSPSGVRRSVPAPVPPARGLAPDEERRKLVPLKEYPGYN